MVHSNSTIAVPPVQYHWHLVVCDWRYNVLMWLAYPSAVYGVRKYTYAPSDFKVIANCGCSSCEFQLTAVEFH